MKRFWMRKVAGIIVFVIAGIFIAGAVLMLLWNNLLPVIFHLPMINFWQALGLLLLSKILFGSFRGGQWGRNGWKRKMQEKWQNMSPDDREKFKQEWRNRCGRRPFEDEKPAQ